MRAQRADPPCSMLTSPAGSSCSRDWEQGVAARCTAASQAVSCPRRASACSAALGVGWFTPSAPGAAHCRDMPVAQALPLSTWSLRLKPTLRSHTSLHRGPRSGESSPCLGPTAAAPCPRGGQGHCARAPCAGRGGSAPASWHCIRQAAPLEAMTPRLVIGSWFRQRMAFLHCRK